MPDAAMIQGAQKYGLAVPGWASELAAKRTLPVAPEMVAKIGAVLDRVAAGASLTAAAKAENVPRQSVTLAIASLPGGAEALAAARSAQADALIDDAAQELDTLRADLERADPALASAIVSAARVRADFKRWHAARICPQLWADKAAAAGVNVAVQVNQLPAERVTAARERAAARFARIMRGEAGPVEASDAGEAGEDEENDPPGPTPDPSCI